MQLGLVTAWWQANVPIIVEMRDASIYRPAEARRADAHHAIFWFGVGTKYLKFLRSEI